MQWLRGYLETVLIKKKKGSQIQGSGAESLSGAEFSKHDGDGQNRINFLTPPLSSGWIFSEQTKLCPPGTCAV